MRLSIALISLLEHLETATDVRFLNAALFWDHPWPIQ